MSSHHRSKLTPGEETKRPSSSHKTKGGSSSKTRGGGSARKDDNYGQKYIDNEKLVQKGRWGGEVVLSNTDNTQQIDNIKDRLNQIYQFQIDPPECFIAQIAFTHLNTFILTTDGRIFSWGGITFCLGRDASQQSEKQIGEIESLSKMTIIRIATGRNHVLALDSKGRVHSWGKNDHGQLGHNDKEQADRDKPERIEKLKEICQIYAGENMSFAVDKFGSTYAWGENKHNQLMLEENEKTRFKTKVDEPTEIKYPSYFISALDKRGSSAKNMQIVLNNQQGVTMYVSKRPVKSIASETQQELDKVKTENFKLTLRIKELEKKLSKVGNYDQMQKEEQENLRNTNEDKVRQNLDTLIQKIEKDSQKAQQEQVILNKQLKAINSEIESYTKQLTEIETKERELLKSGGNKGVESRMQKKDFQESYNGLKSQIHQKLLECEKKRYEIQQTVDQANMQCDEMNENIIIYKNILQERKRYLLNLYLQRSQDDLEKILSTLYSHFENVKMTSFETMSRDSQDYGGSKEILKRSTQELKRLLNELNSQKVEKEDIRYDIFRMIYEMLTDDIQLRLKVNSYIEGILEQTNQKLEKYVSTYQKKAESMKKKQGMFSNGTEPEEEEGTKMKSEFERRKNQRGIEIAPKSDKKRWMCS